MKISRIFIAAAVLFAFFVFFAERSETNELDRVKKLMEGGMYTRAADILEEEINREPLNADAHFHLGVCYVNKERFHNAEKRFASAIKLKPGYKPDIARVYAGVGWANLGRGRKDKASRFFSEAIKYDGAIRKALACEVVAEAKSYLIEGMDDEARSLFSFASEIDPALKEADGINALYAKAEADAPGLKSGGDCLEYGADKALGTVR